MSNLKGVVIDSGHGGSDPGATYDGIFEKDLTLKISEEMYKKFKEYNIPVSMTRISDITLSPEERVNKIESFYGNGSDVIVISNHINAGGGEGVEVIYALRDKDTLAKKILNNLGNDGLVKRKIYQRKSTTNPNKDYYFLLRNTANNESLIVEYGFIDNNNDLSKLLSNYKIYADSVVDAILEYKGISINYYVVKKGDSLYSIAKKYGISVDKLKDLNNLKSDLININQKLLVVGNNIYIVKSGDTLYSIAKKYNTTINKIKSNNNLTSNILQIGQKLII